MPNVLTSLAADMYVAADQVGRELIGAIPSVMRNGSTDEAAIGQTVRSHATRAATAVDITPSMTIPQGTDQTVDNLTLTLTKQRGVQIPWTGEDVKFVNAGSGFTTVYGDQIKQAMRTLANEAEVDLCNEIALSASRAVGTSGTNPFATTINNVAAIRQILVDNGMPTNDGQASIVMNSAAGTSLRNLALLQQANTSGGTDMLRQGVLLDLQGLMLKESAGIVSSVAGTGTSYTSSTAGFAAGVTSVALITGSGTVVAGDVVTFAGDTNQYVVATGIAAPGTIVLAAPGLRQALPASAVAMTITSAFARNFALHKTAAEIAFRAPALPEGGDAATDRMTIQDPVSGLVFQIASYKGYKKSMLEVAAVWGVKAWKPQFIAALKG